jgi:hypothetical protein
VCDRDTIGVPSMLKVIRRPHHFSENIVNLCSKVDREHRVVEVELVTGRLHNLNS